MPQGRLDSAQYMATLQTLDRSFSNINRRDLFAASMPSRSAQELVWCAANNNKGAQATKTWAERLRKDAADARSIAANELPANHLLLRLNTAQKVGQSAARFARNG